MVPYLVTVIILVTASMKKSRNNADPGGLGIACFREER